RARAPAAGHTSGTDRERNPAVRVAITVRPLREAAMRTRVILAILLLAAAGGGAWLLISARNQPPAVSFVKVKRETITDAVPTNGKVEPIEWAEARAERAGPVTAIHVERGQRVEKGAVLVELDGSEAKADLAAGQSRVTQAKSELDVLDHGGRTAD